MNTTKSQGRKATEQHTADSLAERIGTTVEAIEELLQVGALNPVSGNESGDQLVFETEDLDALAHAIESQIEDEVNEATEGQPASKRQFAVARAKYLVTQEASESANAFGKARAEEIRLSRLAQFKDIYLDQSGGIVAICDKGKTPANLEFGIGGDLLAGAVKWGSRLLKRPGKTLGILDKKLPGLVGATKDAALVGGIGAVAGGAKAALDDDPNTSILGGAAKGAAIGGIAGGAGSFAGSRLNPSPALQAQLDALKAKKLATAGRTWAGARI